MKNIGRIVSVGILIRFVIGVIIVVVLWNPLVGLIFSFSQGQDHAYDMGDNYEIWWPGHVIYWESKEDLDFKRIIHSEKIIEFAIEGSWLLAKTEKGWFAINKKTHELYYPFSSKSDLEKEIPLNLSTLTFEKDLSPYIVVYDHTKKAVFTTKCILLSFPFSLSLIPYCLRRWWSCCLAQKII